MRSLPLIALVAALGAGPLAAASLPGAGDVAGKDQHGAARPKVANGSRNG